MEKIFQTTDPYLAAYLTLRGYTLLPAEARSIFRFHPDARLSAEAYYRGASISARDFANALLRLESAVQEAA